MDCRIFIALGVSFLLGVFLYPVFIPMISRMKFGQYVREEGPAEHLKKSGTPTMGGVIILLTMLVASAICSIWYPDVFFIMIFTVLFGMVGLADDILKISKHESEGLKAWQKMGLQVILAAAVVIFIGAFSSQGTETIIPFYGAVDLKGWFYPIAALAVLGTVNGANFTDGLDGLAGSVTSVLAAFFALCALLLEHDSIVSSLAMLGSLLAFLCFNAHPAKLFMGDTGSLALGGFAVVTALMLKMPLFLIIAAFVYLIEILSVMLQVAYFKLTHGKRLFRMSPLHHHFELGGWSETKVVTVFTAATAMLCALALAGLICAR